ncbi:diguanylate cyclase (GGDEF)-like protein/PAS domain S-box-containing protein [Methylohalomonas lacus]|uniref:Diguanylate cyclase (GGDEF)-like protein/PAS domain S-box-containing protein n=1 Tax=Methylohalomonas lacus TaxID=398773 RepID=A0AAE3HM80_9GAMM|nr:PAS domain S-box protein [Methylohalomonas lacus]MCS3903058.1 diguanylate cyclase (GGDEF)-like protein/PAS domain S-box-containing protein [Methylohalomonas lacus]
MSLKSNPNDTFENAFQYAAIGMALVSPQGQWLRVNRALCEITGYSEQELLKLSFQDITHPDDLNMDLDYLRQLLDGELESYTLEKRYFHKNGNIVWILLSVSLMRDEDGQPHFFIAQIQDITDRIMALREMRESEQRLELAIEGAELGTWDWNIRTGHVTFNDRWAKMLGYSLEEIDTHISSWEKRVHPDDAEETREILARHLRGDIEIYESRHRLRHKDGHWIWVLDKGKVIERNEVGDPVRACGTHLDISSRKEYEQQIEQQSEQLRIANEQLDRLAHIDSLTNLYNRRAFTARLREEIQRANRNLTSLSLMMLDIDEFKAYNDTYGHPEGDILLQQLANVLQNSIRASDVAARIGGEEFAVILPETNVDDARRVAEKLCRSIAGYPWDLRSITVSIGVTTKAVEHSMTTDSSVLLSRVDAALYYSKSHGKNRATHSNSIDKVQK